jgi:hypothetical protein
VCGGGEAAYLDAIQGQAARTAGDGYGDVTVTVKAMAMAMERVPRVLVDLEIGQVRVARRAEVVGR